MLTITISKGELYDEINGEFIYVKDQTLVLEHSLVSISKWEAKWKKPFISKDEKTVSETLDYIRCMTTTQNVDESVYAAIDADNIRKVKEYIDDPMTATTFSNQASKSVNREIITSEVIYYRMIAFNIPFECQKWHLNRLLTLIEVCNRKNNPPKPSGKNELAQRNAALNAARRQALGSGG